MFRFLIFILITISIVGCRFRESSDFENDIIDPPNVDSIVVNIIMYGDTTQLSELSQYYRENGEDIEMLPYYIVLADKYNTPCVYSKIYYLAYQYHLCEPKLMTLGLEYLNKGAKIGNRNCLRILDDLKKTNLEKKE